MMCVLTYSADLWEICEAAASAMSIFVPVDFEK